MSSSSRLSKGNFFKTCVLSQCIVYWIHFQNIHTFTYQKAFLHTLSLLVSKIVESLQCILNWLVYLFWEVVWCSAYLFLQNMSNKEQNQSLESSKYSTSSSSLEWRGREFIISPNPIINTLKPVIFRDTMGDC